MKVKRLIVDLDNTLTKEDVNKDYTEKSPRFSVISTLRDYKEKGYEIVIFTARNMKTFKGNLGKININTLPVITAWLDEHAVPYDEILVGKPWCGEAGFYVDDRAIRPSEFVELSEFEIQTLLSKN